MEQNFEDQFKVVNQVREITYPCLEYAEGNRPINDKHAKELKKAIIEGENIPAILVDRKTHTIVDGQHRYEGFCLALEEGYEVALKVVFDDFDDPVVSACKFNENMMNWGTKDFVYSGLARNKPQYITLEQFCRDRKLLMFGTRPKYNSAIVLLFGTELRDGIKDLPEITKENVLAGDNRYRTLELIVNKLGEDNKVAFFQGGAIKGFLKFLTTIRDSEKVKDFIANGISNRFSKPTRDGVGIWYQYYRNMYDAYRTYRAS